MNLYQITDLAGNWLDDVRGHISATDHRAAALAVSVDIVAFDQPHGRRNIGPNVDMDYGHHYVDMIGNREIVVTDVEDATDTRPEVANATVADFDEGDSGTIAEGKFEGRAFTVRSKGTMGRFVMVDWTEQGTRGSIDATTEVTR